MYIVLILIGSAHSVLQGQHRPFALAHNSIPANSHRRHPEKPHYIYRALSKQDLNQVLGGKNILSAKRYGLPLPSSQQLCPNGGFNCPICHVALGVEKSTDFISTSISREDANDYDSFGMVRVDVNKLDPLNVIDLTLEPVRQKMLNANGNEWHENNSKLAKAYSSCDKEVLVKGEIPFAAYELLYDTFADSAELFPFITHRPLN